MTRPWRRGRIAVFGLLALLGVAGSWQAWNRRLRDRVFPRRFVPVEPGGLYRSGQIASGLVEDVLAEHAIGTIVWLARL